MAVCGPVSAYEPYVQHHLDVANEGLGGGNGNPLQYSCLENPVDTGAWWAAVHRVAQSQTRLKRLSSSSSSSNEELEAAGGTM